MVRRAGAIFDAPEPFSRRAGRCSAGPESGDTAAGFARLQPTLRGDVNMLPRRYVGVAATIKTMKALDLADRAGCRGCGRPSNLGYMFMSVDDGRGAGGPLIERRARGLPARRRKRTGISELPRKLAVIDLTGGETNRGAGRLRARGLGISRSSGDGHTTLTWRPRRQPPQLRDSGRPRANRKRGLPGSAAGLQGVAARLGLAA